MCVIISMILLFVGIGALLCARNLYAARNLKKSCEKDGALLFTCRILQIYDRFVVEMLKPAWFGVGYKWKREHRYSVEGEGYPIEHKAYVSARDSALHWQRRAIRNHHLRMNKVRSTIETISPKGGGN